MMMIGYAMDHPSGTYRFYNPTTDHVVVSNSVKWSDYKRWEATLVNSVIGNLLEEKTVTETVVDISDQKEDNEDTVPIQSDNTDENVLPDLPSAQRRAVTQRMTQKIQPLSKVFTKSSMLLLGRPIKLLEILLRLTLIWAIPLKQLIWLKKTKRQPTLKFLLSGPMNLSRHVKMLVGWTI